MISRWFARGLVSVLFAVTYYFPPTSTSGTSYLPAW